MRLSYILFISIFYSQEVQISVDRNKINEGDMFTLSIEVNNSENFANVDIMPLKKDFEIVSGPGQQTNIQWINGKMTSTKTLTWTLLPKRVGRLTIPTLSILVDGKSYSNKSINIDVSKNNNNDNNSVFLLADIDRKSAYLGQQITVTYKLYKKSNVNLSIEPFQLPEFSGFWVNQLYSPQRVQYQDVTVKGVKYQMANLGQIALFPISSDKHIIPELKIKAQIEKKNKKRRNDPFFDPFFGSLFNERETKFIKSKKKTINILPFPDPKPFDFSGAVGSFKISSSCDVDSATVNDGFTFKILLEGTGNLGLFSIPSIEFPEQLEAFPPTDNFEKDVFRDKITGIQSWEYILIPRKEGNVSIPRIQISYFDPEIGTWVRTQTDPIILNVKHNDVYFTENSGLTKKEIELIGQDIRYIHTDPIKFNSIFKINRNTVIFLYLCSIFIFATPTVFNKYNGHRYATFENRQAKKALKKALAVIKNNDGDPFEAASLSFYFYLKERLILSSSNLDPISVEMILSEKVSSKLMSKILIALKTCDEGKYAPDGLVKQNEILMDMELILKQIEKELV